jgi:hypothetical protein
MNAIKWFSMLSILFVSQTVVGQSHRTIARHACELRDDADHLGMEIEAHLHGSHFERRLLNDAAECYRLAANLEATADRQGNVHAMEGQARVLKIVLDRMDRTLTELETQAIRDSHLRGGRCSTREVRSFVMHMCHGVSNLQRDLEVLCNFQKRRPIEIRPMDYRRAL